MGQSLSIIPPGTPRFSPDVRQTGGNPPPHPAVLGRTTAELLQSFADMAMGECASPRKADRPEWWAVREAVHKRLYAEDWSRLEDAYVHLRDCHLREAFCRTVAELKAWYVGTRLRGPWAVRF